MGDWECSRCDHCPSMVVVEGGKKHLYECPRCHARAVIVPKTSNDEDGVFRYDMPAPNAFPSTGETPRPKGGASSGPSGGEGETTSRPEVLGVRGLAQAVAEVMGGRSAVDIAKDLVPDGTTIVVGEDGKLEVFKDE